MSLNDLEFTIDFGGFSSIIEIKGSGLTDLFPSATAEEIVEGGKVWLNAKIGTAIEATVKQVLIAEWLADNVTITP